MAICRIRVNGHESLLKTIIKEMNDYARNKYKSYLLYTIPLSRYESDINYALTNKCH